LPEPNWERLELFLTGFTSTHVPSLLIVLEDEQENGTLGKSSKSSNGTLGRLAAPLWGWFSIICANFVLVSKSL